MVGSPSLTIAANLPITSSIDGSLPFGFLRACAPPAGAIAGAGADAGAAAKSLTAGGFPGGFWPGKPVLTLTFVGIEGVGIGALPLADAFVILQ